MALLSYCVYFGGVFFIPAYRAHAYLHGQQANGLNLGSAKLFSLTKDKTYENFVYWFVNSDN